ncbi:class I SAM-dependent methyltransferase [Thalassospira alkalitolerans]|uniref:class I SAM-dependent methyltransferase n=1 Tax=Thalassospira alkalitolerans TaxID=1293890 RepID=UPI003AA8117C
MEDDDNLRFGFGRNWEKFLENITDRSVCSAKESLIELFGVSEFSGKTFLDIGCGSGLSSLSAVQLGASVYSFDYDEASVQCALYLREKYKISHDVWRIEKGSVLDKEYLISLGQFDFVYSWGVLHHTGGMWDALDNIKCNLRSNAKLCIAIYNDQGGTSKRWTAIKKIYNSLPKFLRTPYVCAIVAPSEFKSITIHFLRGCLGDYVSYVRDYDKNRGMSWWTDKVDWVGGYPFEVAQPEEIFNFYRKDGYTLDFMTTCGGGLGCNQYVFTVAES